VKFLGIPINQRVMSTFYIVGARQRRVVLSRQHNTRACKFTLHSRREPESTLNQLSRGPILASIVALAFLSQSHFKSVNDGAI
jgi:hypothetical protein